MAGRGLGVNLRQSDFRELAAHFEERFDCVGSTGNSLPYVSNEEIFRTLEQMGYRDIRILCHPAYFENADMEKADWYCVMDGKAL